MYCFTFMHYYGMKDDSKSIDIICRPSIIIILLGSTLHLPDCLYRLLHFFNNRAGIIIIIIIIFYLFFFLFFFFLLR